MFNDNKTFINVNEEIRRETMKRYSFFLALAAMLVLSFGLANGQNALYLSSVNTGYSGPDTVAVGAPIVWTISLRMAAGDTLNGSNNGWIIHDGGSGSSWTLPVIDTVDLLTSTGFAWKTRYDGLFRFYRAPTNNGSGTDTVGLGGFSIDGIDGEDPPLGVSFTDGFDLPAITISVTVPNDADNGKTICLDSSGYGPNEEWLWSAADSKPDWSGPHCYTIFKVPNQPPDITNCQASLDFDHCALAEFQYEALDRDTLGARPLTFVQNSGPGSTSSSGLWSYAPTLADVGASLSIDVQAQDTPGNLGPNCVTSLNFTNVAPSFTDGCNETIPIGKGNTLVFDFDAVSDDCDPISFSISGVSPTPVGGYSIDASTGLVTFNTDNDDGDKQFVFTVCVTDGKETVCCETTIDVLFTEPYEVLIEKTHNTAQGGHELVCVTLEKGSEQMWGFDFLIAYDASALSFQTALEGSDLYANGCGWEYFNYRYGASGNCGNACPSGQLRVVGIAETNNGANHPACYLPSSLPAEMFCLDFLVTADQTFECQYIPIRFFWYDCGDNTISFNPAEDVTGFEQRLAISRAVIDFDLVGDIANPNVGYPTVQGAQDVDCYPAGADPEKPAPVRFIDFLNGGIDIVCVDSIDDRGDINLNNVANEVADAVLFTNYFIYGIGVFNINLQGQIAATDVNADGLTLSVADLVYLIRIVLGDALPFAKTVPVEAIYTVNSKGILEVDIEVGAAALQLQGNVEPTLLAENMDMEYAFDAANNVTRVLVYNNTDKDVSFTGEFINTNGSVVVSIEMATYDGAPITAKEVELPTEFALNQNYPNPFNPSTNISFALPTASNYTLTIYNVAGQKVADFAGNAEAGIVNVEWDASNQASGVYFYRVVADSKDGQFKETKKMVLLK